jgi:hypothetical protein
MLLLFISRLLIIMPLLSKLLLLAEPAADCAHLKEPRCGVAMVMRLTGATSSNRPDTYSLPAAYLQQQQQCRLAWSTPVLHLASSKNQLHLLQTSAELRTCRTGHLTVKLCMLSMTGIHASWHGC